MARTRIPIPDSWREAEDESKRLKTLETPVADSFPVRTVNALEDNGVLYFSDLVTWSVQDLESIPNLGAKTVAEISDVVRKFGLRLREEQEEDRQTRRDA